MNKANQPKQNNNNMPPNTIDLNQNLEESPFHLNNNNIYPNYNYRNSKLMSN